MTVVKYDPLLIAAKKKKGKQEASPLPPEETDFRDGLSFKDLRQLRNHELTANDFWAV